MVITPEPLRINEMVTNTDTATMPREQDDDSGRFVESYPLSEFAEALRAEGGMASTSEVAERVGCSSRLALIRLQELADTDRVDRRNVGNAHLWILDGDQGPGPEPEQ